jgi:uncharacterized membrane-anchored protein
MFDGIWNPGQTSEAGKIPALTLLFWVIKIAATTLGETGGDALSMSFRLGYAASTGIFIVLFLAAVAVQCRVRSFHPALYWTVIVATTTAGTTMADFADRSLGYGYAGGSLLLAGLLAATLLAWRASTGSVAISSITTTKAELFYWVVILFSNTLGTALGDYAADSGLGGAGLGYERGALVFAAGLALVALAYAVTRRARITGAVPLLFWSAFILTRPLGATLGDMLTKPHGHGGLALSRVTSSLVIAGFIAGCVIMLPQRAARTHR